MRRRLKSSIQQFGEKSSFRKLIRDDGMGTSPSQPLRWHSATDEIIEFPSPKPERDGKLWVTLLKLQKAGFVRVTRDTLGVLRFCAVKQEAR